MFFKLQKRLTRNNKERTIEPEAIWRDAAKKRKEKEEKMSEIKLLPCPFCDEEAKAIVFVDNSAKIECKQRCFDGTHVFKDVEEAARAWNTRKPMERIVERLNNKFRVVKSDEDLEWNRAINKAIEIVKEEGGLNE